MANRRIRQARRLAEYGIPLLFDPPRAYAVSKKVIQALQEGGVKLLSARYSRAQANYYPRWIAQFDTLTPEDHRLIRKRLEALEYQPLISVVMPVYNTDPELLRETIGFVRSQLYERWELCIADDCSTREETKQVLRELAAADRRIKVTFRERNGHISEASNTALELVTGEFVALLDHDDVLREHALYCVVEELNSHRDADLIYSDQDKIDKQGKRYEPLLKPDWNPDLFYSQNYINHLSVIRFSLMREVGGFRTGFEGSQDYDLVLRVIEKTQPSRIRHIPRVLYHWRAIEGSVALADDEKLYPHERARRAIQEHLDRRGISAKVEQGYRSYHRVVYPLPDKPPLVSIIIGTRDKAKLLRGTLEGILERTDYRSLDVIVLDNQSKERETLDYFKELEREPRVRILQYDAPFSFSAMNDFGVKHARGEIIALLNNDLEVISRQWLSEMVSHALRPEVGAVGAKLYYPDDRIQHAGVVLGIGGVAGHAHRFSGRREASYGCRAHLIQGYSAVTGACIVMRRAVFDEVGGLDERNLAVAFNDVDLCLKIGERGYRIVWTPYAELYHLESASRGPDDLPETYPRFKKEFDHMRRKWLRILDRDPNYNVNLSVAHEDFSLAFPPRSEDPWKRNPH